MLLLSALGPFAAAACTQHCPGAGACAMPPRFDLVVTEADSGGAGISTAESDYVAFVLDSRRDQLATTPRQVVTKSGDSYGQFPGQSLFIFYPRTSGVFDITATGGGMAPFTFHLIVGVLRPYPASSSVLLNVGDIVVEQWNAACGDGPPPALNAPAAFDLIQDQYAVSTTTVPAILQFTLKRRAYRVLQQLTGWPVPTATPFSAGICLPTGFPRYPLMQSMGGVSATCTWEMAANDSQAAVLAFYKSLLNQGGWHVDSATGSTIAFTQRYAFRGSLTVSSDGVVHVHVAAGPPTTCF
jgi:hypothetical protein